MSLKFKIAEQAGERRVRQILDELRHEGVVAERLFPRQRRPALATIFVVADPKVDGKRLNELLRPYGEEIDFVEGPVERKPMAQQAD